MRGEVAGEVKNLVMKKKTKRKERSEGPKITGEIGKEVCVCG